jgi:CIC family chloride channel protein
VLSALTGAAIGVIGTAFRVAAERAFAAYAHALASGLPGPLPAWLPGVLASAGAVALAVLVTRRFMPEAAGSGIQEIEGALAGVRPIPRWKGLLPVKFFGGLVAIAAGLILGREGPTIHMGGSVGAAFGALVPSGRERAKVLVGAGAGAGLAVAFNAPMGGILFAMEEMRREFPLDLRKAQCVFLACISATLVSVMLTGPVRILPIPLYGAPTLLELACVVPFALGVGVYGVFFNRALVRALDTMHDVLARVGWVIPALLVGGGFGFLVWAAVDLTGGGESLTVRLLANPPAVGVLALLLLGRTLLFNVSYAAGTPGGIFAPQLAFGTLLALLFVGGAAQLAPDLALEPGRFAVAGMAALLTATVRAPLTGLALVVEMTGNYALIPMALLASVVADLTADALGGRPIYDVLLDRAVGRRTSP